MTCDKIPEWLADGYPSTVQPIECATQAGDLSAAAIVAGLLAIGFALAALGVAGLMVWRAFVRRISDFQ